MIIADRESRWKVSRKQILRLLIAVVLLGAAAYFIYPIYLLRSTAGTSPALLYCDAEMVWRKSFVSNGQFFTRGNKQTDQEAFSGRYSNYIEATTEGLGYGVSGTLSRIEGGQTYRASVWFKVEREEAFGGLVLTSQGNPQDPDAFYLSSEEASPPKNGWRQLEILFEAPQAFPHRELQVYVYSNGLGMVYFDELKVELLDDFRAIDYSLLAFEPSQLALQVRNKNMRKLQDKRDEAFENGILMTDEDSWVKASLADGEEIVPVKIRLKGDWTDHLEKNKWSFRVKVKDPQAWNRMIVFSLQTPKARYFADEWLLHQFFEREDVLTTRYDFVGLSMNDKALGVYAYEEHFDKQLLEYRNRREGPILRLVEDALWASRVRSNEHGVYNYLPNIAEQEKADIQPFKSSRTAANPKLRADFELARSLLHQYQQGFVDAGAVFDLELTGKYFAICDVMGSYHGSIWHNQRFYYNPITTKLEPIGYDGYSNGPYAGAFMMGKPLIVYAKEHSASPLKNLMEDSEFLHHYLYYLDRFSTKKYLDSFYFDLGKELEKRTEFINQEFPDYSHDRYAVFGRAKQIRAMMKPYAEHSVRAYWTENEQKAPVLQLRNLHEMPLEFLGTSTQKEEMTFPLEKSVLLGAYYVTHPIQTYEVDVPVNAKYYFYRAYGSEEVFCAEISKWSAKLPVVPAQEYRDNIDMIDHPFYEVQGKTVHFRPGTHQIKKDVIIPPGFEVRIAAGTQLDFQRGSKFLSYSPIYIQGSMQEPVRIVSTDHSARGFTVLQAGERSLLNYVIFDHFNTLQDRGWQLTGAVTFYESDVDIQHCIFENNHCEDGLNLIRSNFLLDNVTVRNTPSDGFDADFCEGIIRESNFVDTGNDGIDVSGSKVDVQSAQLLRNGDKGISVGENSEMKIKKALVDEAVIGVASKDLSFLLIQNIELKDCNQGFVAYQKKPEYGPSIIQVLKYDHTNVNYLHTIAPACTLRLGKKLIIGER